MYPDELEKLEEGVEEEEEEKCEVEFHHSLCFLVRFMHKQLEGYHGGLSNKEATDIIDKTWPKTLEYAYDRKAWNCML